MHHESWHVKLYHRINPKIWSSKTLDKSAQLREFNKKLSLEIFCHNTYKRVTKLPEWTKTLPLTMLQSSGTGRMCFLKKQNRATPGGRGCGPSCRPWVLCVRWRCVSARNDISECCRVLYCARGLVWTFLSVRMNEMFDWSYVFDGDVFEWASTIGAPRRAPVW